MPRSPSPMGSSMIGRSRFERTTRAIPTTRLRARASRMNREGLLSDKVAGHDVVWREMIASIDLVARHEPLDFDRAGVLNPRPRRGNDLLLGCSLLCFRLMCAAPHRRWLFLSSRSLRSAVGPHARFLARLLELLILNDEKLTLTDLV